MDPWRYSARGASASRCGLTPRAGGRDDIDGIEDAGRWAAAWVKVRVRAIAEGRRKPTARVDEAAGGKALHVAQGQKCGCLSGGDLAASSRLRSTAIPKSLGEALARADIVEDRLKDQDDGPHHRWKKPFAAELRARVRRRGVARGQTARHGLTPGLAVVLVGQRSGQRKVYVRRQAHADARAPAWPSFEHRACRPTSPRDDVLALIAKLNRDGRGPTGILVQLPLPKSLHTENHHQCHRSRQGTSMACIRTTPGRLAGGFFAALSPLHAARLHHP